jgi:hypothetical protein
MYAHNVEVKRSGISFLPLLLFLISSLLYWHLALLALLAHEGRGKGANPIQLQFYGLSFLLSPKLPPSHSSVARLACEVSCVGKELNSG